MKQLSFTLLLFLTTIFSAQCQSSFLKLIEKGKFAKAEKKITKALSNDSNDVGTNYAYALLLSKRKHNGYNSEKAYITLLKSKQGFEGITDEKQLEKLNKIPINAQQYRNYLDTICRQALEDISSQNDVAAFQQYLDFYLFAPTILIQEATSKRDSVAFSNALNNNTIDSYDAFIRKYPNAEQYTEATERRDQIAFSKAQTTDNIDEYKTFIKKYPKSKEAPQATSRIHELAFATAEKENTSIAYKRFANEYQNSKQYPEAIAKYESLLLTETTSNGNWESYRDFIDGNPGNSLISIAEDSLFMVANKTGNLNALKYCADNFSGEKQKKAILAYHDLFTMDGETETLDLFYNSYTQYYLNEQKIKDYEIATLGNKLALYLPYNSSDWTKYDQYIKLAAPNEKAFVALQRLISTDISIKNWSAALIKVKSYSTFFGADSKKFNDLISILQSKFNSTIKINTVGFGVNTSDGGEYMPVISADDRFLYFCGRDRKDNIGGEDIFMSKKINGKWGESKIVSDLSSYTQNDAPLSVSADGTTMLFFKSGKLYYAEKSPTGWSNSVEFPENINEGKWQADAMISSDGKAMIFSAVREGNLDLYILEKPYGYHGSADFASDIYVSLKDEGDNWGNPINLGSQINTIFCDRTPFLHPDMKTLYFSSEGRGGLGKLDVFKSTRLSDTCWTCWSEPVNMGKEINTEASDWGYKISTDGDKAYFAKSANNNENYDIFWLNLPKSMRPDYVATISGKLVDKNNQPVAAEIRWEDLETGKSIGQSKSDPADGSFFIVLPLGKIYGYYVDKDQHFPISNNIDLRKNDKPVQLVENIDIVTFNQMVQDSIAVPVNNLFFKFGESTLLPYSIPELKRIAKIIIDNHLKVEISGHTDNIGDDTQNQTLSEKRSNSVKEFLITEGCTADNLITKGYGKTKPVASNETEAGRAKNRRVELNFVK